MILNKLRGALLRLAALFRGRAAADAADADLRAEMESHLHMEIVENLRRYELRLRANKRAYKAAREAIDDID